DAPAAPDDDGAADADAAAAPAPADGAAVAALVDRLRHEQVVLHTELEQARLQVASMQASPFWRARRLYMALRHPGSARS
ncbi:MAG TPA: hypothetical protein VMB72_16865, partial [Acidimicrobiales bacterium]|nr:hypothetical protein [Acidimicrobiales bacterium]